MHIRGFSYNTVKLININTLVNYLQIFGKYSLVLLDKIIEQVVISLVLCLKV
jgi:hypothetical protein